MEIWLLVTEREATGKTVMLIQQLSGVSVYKKKLAMWPMFTKRCILMAAIITVVALEMNTILPLS